MAWKFEGNVSLIPHMADTFYSLLIDLVETSRLHREKISYPAGAVIIGVACLESYINELIEIHSFRHTGGKDRKLNRSLLSLGTDIVRKLDRLKALAKKPEEISEDLLEDFRLLFGLRGKLAHYEIQEEKPTDPSYKSRLEVLEKRLLKGQQPQGDTSLERILTTEFAEWVIDLVTKLITGLYKGGYEPPRPRWIELIDPGRFGPRS